MSNANGFTVNLIAVYPHTTNPNYGTFHVEWIEGKCQIRGCRFEVKKKGLWVSMPTGTDLNHGERQSYAILDFNDKEMNKNLCMAMRAVFEAYIKSKDIKWSPPPERKPVVKVSLKRALPSIPAKRPERPKVSAWDQGIRVKR
jgi:hypothetical protein